MNRPKLLPFSLLAVLLAVFTLAWSPPAPAQPGDGFLLASPANLAPVLAQPTPPEPVQPNAGVESPKPVDASEGLESSDTGSPESASSEVKADDGNGDKEVTAEELTKQGQGVVQTWKTLGWLAGLAALVGFLIALLKFKPVDRLFEKWKVKWIKPFIASVLGGISAGIGAYLLDKDIVSAIVAGLVIVGPGAVGFFEQLSKLKKRNRDSGKEGSENGDG